MKTMQLKITTLSPVLLSSDPPAHNLLRTLEFIPGSAIRGIFTRQYLSMKGAADQTFSDLFLSGRVKFGFARINGSRVIPLSARSCKYYGGFLTPSGEAHGVVDLLFHDKTDMRCPSCSGPMDYCEGFYDPIKGKEDKVETRIITHSAINGKLCTASSGQLYSQRVIEEGQTFIGTVEIADDLFDVFIDLISKPLTGALGTGRSRGQGWVKVWGEEISGRASKKATERHVHISERWKSLNSNYPTPPLVVTLLSDALLHDEYLRDLTGPSLAHLKESFDINPADWESAPSPAFSATRLIHGFDGLPWRLPRAPRTAVAAGSVFVFVAKTGSPRIPTGDGIGWIGDRNVEGFGSVILWDHFHIPTEKGVAS